MECENKIKEARRYVSNAKTILKDKALKDGLLYTDSKYVKLAGHALWTGCLVALDYALKIKPKKNQRLDIDDYKAAAAKHNKKLLTMINSGYETMHLYMGYDGNKTYSLCKGGVDTANAIIDWCEKNAPKK